MGVVFAKRCEFLVVSLKEGFGVGFRWVGGVVFLWKRREKRKGLGTVGGGVGTRRGAGKSLRTRLSKLLFVRSGTTDPVQFERRFKQGPFCL